MEICLSRQQLRANKFYQDNLSQSSAKLAHFPSNEYCPRSDVFEDNPFSLQPGFSTQSFMRTGAGLELRTLGGSSLFVSCKGGKVCYILN